MQKKDTQRPNKIYLGHQTRIPTYNLTYSEEHNMVIRLFETLRISLPLIYIYCK